MGTDELEFWRSLVVVPTYASYELTELVDRGLTPLAAILAGTRNTADTLTTFDRVGSLKPSKQANLLLLN